MSTNLVDQVTIKIDERYSVSVSKDHNQGVVIQVARLNPTHVRGDTGVTYKGHTPVIMYQRVVSYGTSTKDGSLNFKEDAQLQSEINQEIVKAKEVANRCALKESFIDAVFAKVKSELG